MIDLALDPWPGGLAIATAAIGAALHELDEPGP